MLKIVIEETELFNDKTNEFYKIPKTTLNLEHSLLSISKWESKHCKSFFYKNDKTAEEMIDYIKCMTLTTGVDDRVYSCLTRDHITQIGEYMKAPMTARTSYKKNNKGYSFTTAEDIYYNMIMNNIPFECQKWHLNRLMALINYCNIHNNTSGKKMSAKQQMEMYRDLNASRRAALHSKG